MKPGRFLICLSVGLALSGLAQPQPTSSPSSRPDGRHKGFSDHDYRFAEHAFRSGVEESQLGELAHQKGTSQAVRDFGARMANEHSKANEELKALIAGKGAVLAISLTRTEAATIKRLKALSGDAFDKAYAREMLRIHTRDVRDFQAAAKDLADPDLLAWAVKTLAVLERHERLARELEASLRESKQS